jgi:ComEC/Rec2-related protein
MFFAFIASGVLIGAALLFTFIKRKQRLAALICFSVGLGVLSFSLHDTISRQPVLAMAGETLTITGTITDLSPLAFYTANYVVRTEIGGVSTQIRITSAETAAVRIGDVITADVTLSHFRDTATFPERSYNHSQGVLLKGITDGIFFSQHRQQTPIGYIREYNSRIQSRIAMAFPGDVGGLLRAVTLGDTSGLTPELRQNIRVAGIGYYTAVSGLHMTMVTHMFMLVFGVMPFARNRKIKFAVMLCVVLTVAVFFNMSVSVIRSALMLVIYFGGELFMRKSATLNSLGFALFVILLFQPHAVFDAGLLMSFAGTFGISRVQDSGVVVSGIGGFLSKIRRAFTGASYAALCVLPISAVFFGGVSLLSVLTSVIILPFFTVAVGAVMMFAVFSLLGRLDILSELCLLVAGIMAKIMLEILAFLGGIRFAWFNLGYWFVPFWIGFSIVTVIAVYLFYKTAHDKHNKIVKSACLCVVTLFFMVGVYNLNAVQSERTYISIYSDSVAAWVNVRQADTELIVITADTPQAYLAVSQETQTTPTLMVLLNTARNNEAAFRNLADTLGAGYVPPNTTGIVYDISGRLTLDIGYTCENEVVIILHCKNGGHDYRILFTRASNNNASPANAVVASGVIRNKREFNADYVVYVSRSVPIEYDFEHSAYFEALYLIFY